VKLVQLRRQDGDGAPEVIAAVGPMDDAAADGYAAALQQLLGRRAEPGVSAGTTTVESTSGAAAEPPADPADLLRAVLSREDGGS
jgi:hypothetical protein